MGSKRAVAVVTGGSRGIGLALLKELWQEGWKVHFCSRSEESVAEALERLRGELGSDAEERLRGAPVDVRNQSEVDAYVEGVLEDSGRIDLLVNNAGLGVFKPVHELSGEEWRRTLETNLDGVFYFTRAVAPAMIRQGDGWIVNIASLASRNPFAGGSAYNASKFGLLGFSEATMLDLRQHGVRVSAILPGSVATDFHDDRGIDPEAAESWMLAPEDVSRAVMDLLRYPARALPSRVELRPTRTSS